MDDETLARLSAYLDGALSDEDRAAIERQLAVDTDLAAELAALRRVDALVQASAEPVPEVDWNQFTRDNRTRRQSARPARRPLLRTLRPVAAAAVVALMATAAVWWQSGEEDRTTETTETMVEVRVQRTTLTRSISTASVSRTLPPDALATTGPAPHGRTLVVTVSAGAAYPGGEQELEDDAALF